MNILAVDTTGIESLFTVENVKFAIQIVSFLIVGIGFVYQTGARAVDKYKLKKAERERDEAYVMLDNNAKVMVNVMDGMNLLVNGSKNIKTEDKIKFNTFTNSVVTLVQESQSVFKPIVEGLKEEGKEILEDIKEDALDFAVDLGKTVLDKYTNPE
jgi:ribosomal protein S4E